MQAGTIIFLNGTSSSGKTSIAKELQGLLDELYLHVGIDHFLVMVPRQFIGVGPRAHEGFHWVRGEHGLRIEAGPVGHQVMHSVHVAVAAMARAGSNLIVDEVLFDPTWLAEYATLLADLPAYFVGVRCAREVALERERARGDRAVGLVAAHFDLVHAHGVYDLEVDTDQLSPRACALRIQQRLRDGSPPTAFRQLATQYPAIEMKVG